MNASATATIDTHRVFNNGDSGIACYRIPSIVRMKTGELLAVAEARVENCGDHGGPIRLAAKIGVPTGRNWSDPIFVAKNVLPDGDEYVTQNPAAVVDKMDSDQPGKIVLMFDKSEHGETDLTAGIGVRRVFVIESVDNGRTWVNERDITSFVHRVHNPTYSRIHADASTRYSDPADWRAHFPPVGHAIQIQSGPTRGRLLFATYATVGDATIAQGQAHLVYSDDHGVTWISEDLSPVRGVNEMMAVEVTNGNVLVNFRNYVDVDNNQMKGRGQFVFHLKPDGTYRVPTEFSLYPDLPMPPGGLQGSIHRLLDSPDGPMFYTGVDNNQVRTGLTLWRSDDEGENWNTVRTIDPGPSAYADMVTLCDGRLGILYETGGKDGIVFGALSV